MRIAISGTTGIGKSTLINDFLNNWSSYKTPDSSYRDVLKDKNYPHSKNCNKEGQWAILNSMLDEMQKYSKDDKVIFDRCPWDMLVYSLWASEKGSSDIDKEFIDKIIPIVKNSLKNLDLILFIPISKHSPVAIEDNGKRETDPDYIAEIDWIFKALFHEYQHSLGKTPFFDAEDSPAIIEIFGNPLERIMLIQQYLNVDGEVIGDEGDSILNPDNIEELEKLMLEQLNAEEKERYYNKNKSMVDEFMKTEKLRI